MKVEIFDVELGQCAMIHCPNGKKLMIDAGHKSMTWWPSVHFHGQRIELLALTNYDEDHTSDFAGVQRDCGVNAILRNPTVNSTRLNLMKAASGGMGTGIRAVYEWMQWVERQPGGAPAQVDLGGVTCRWYCNSYGEGQGQFLKSNNLSLAAFVSYGAFTILFPGDLETAGWRQLLLRPDFKADLARTSVLMASHHGRDNGCCEEVFESCAPQTVIISDAGHQHATQQTVNWYANRVTGCRTTAGADRQVFTTRNDGKITIDVVNAQGGWNISTGEAASPLGALAALLGAY